MRAKLRSWWQKIKQYRVTIGVITGVLVITISLILVGYFAGTGFGGYNKVTTTTEVTSSPPKITRTEEYQPGKNLWDLLQLLIIPLVLTLGAVVFNQVNTRTEREIAQRRYDQDQQIALDKQREDLLQSYLDRMSELLLSKKLHISQPDEEARNIARVRTINTLIQLDAKRVGYVFAFLREAGLMKGADSIVSLREANLFFVKWDHAILSGAYLIGANLSGAYLSGANLSGAYLNEADLSGAYLSGANLSGAYLYRAKLNEADLRGADLSGAFLKGAKIEKEKLSAEQQSVAIWT